MLRYLSTTIYASYFLVFWIHSFQHLNCHARLACKFAMVLNTDRLRIAIASPFHCIPFYVFSCLLSQALTILKHKDPHESFTCMTSPSFIAVWHIHMDKLKHISSIYNRSLDLQPNYQQSLPGEIMLSNLRENVPT